MGILLAGHEPHISSLAARLIGAPPAAFMFKKGGICRIDIDAAVLSSGAGRGRLVWHITPKQLRAAAGKGQP
jgi:phosphohistidine phosphatase SixA